MNSKLKTVLWLLFYSILATIIYFSKPEPGAISQQVQEIQAQSEDEYYEGSMNPIGDMLEYMDEDY